MKKTSKKAKIPVTTFDAEVLRGNFKYAVEYEYESYGPRNNRCSCDGYCRCQVYSGLRVKNGGVDLNYITNKICGTAICGTDKNDVTFYCVDRILRANKVYDASLWVVDASRGYYGEEIGDITIENPQKIIDQLNNMYAMSDIDRIRYVLSLEYGYVLPKLLNYKKAEIKMVSTSEVFFPQDEYRKKVQTGDNDVYVNWCGVCGVCVEELCDVSFRKSGTLYKLVDGYHRCCSAILQNRNKVLIALLSY